MTLSTQSPRVQYTANGTRTVFEFAFGIFQHNDLQVFVDSVRQYAGFTITDAVPAPGGTVTFDVAPANGLIVTLERICRWNAPAIFRTVAISPRKP